MKNQKTASRRANAHATAGSPAPRRIGHGGVIDLHTYAAPNVSMARMDAFIGYLVRRFDNRIHDSFLQALGHEDITPARFTALMIIAANPGARQVDIAKALEVARPAALKVVNQLIELGLVEAHPIPSDKRIGALALTARGHEKLALYEREVHAHEARLCQAITDEERQALDTILHKLLA